MVVLRCGGLVGNVRMRSCTGERNEERIGLLFTEYCQYIEINCSCRQESDGEYRRMGSEWTGEEEKARR